MLYVIIAIVAVVVAFALVLIIRASRFKPLPAAQEKLPDVPMDGKGAVKRLCEAVTYRTVTYADEDKVDWTQFEGLRGWLESAYPAVHKTLEREVVSRASLLYKWTGKDPSLKPFGLLAHMDVVPVEEHTVGDWTHPPFDGYADDDAVWGRGSNDMKNQLVALFEAVETLIGEGFEPERDVYICLGHNEEVPMGDKSGARTMAKLLEERGVHMEFILDEGGAVMEEPPFGLSTPVAMIGLAEKGFVDFGISVLDAGGHSSEPPKHTALGKLAKVITFIERSPMKQKLISPVTKTFDAIGRYMGFSMRLILANQWLFKPLLKSALAKEKQTNAMTRTTMAATMCEASPASNVLPQRASVTINSRILPGETMDDVKKHIERVVAKSGVSVEVALLRGSEPVPERTTAWAYDAILRFLPAISDGIVAAPYLVMGGTDSREYVPVTDEIYRFYPFIVNKKELAAMHATDERIRISSLIGAVKFNYHFIKGAASRVDS